jgi:hypothetical protein
MLENIGAGKCLIRRVVSLLANQECGQLSDEDDLLLANLQAELRLLREDLSGFNFFSLEINLDPDEFLDYLVNCIRNDVLSIQRYFSLTRSKYKKNLLADLADLKLNFTENSAAIFSTERQLFDILDKESKNEVAKF